MALHDFYFLLFLHQNIKIILLNLFQCIFLSNIETITSDIMLQKLTKKWKSYKYRFLPWLLFNFRSELRKSDGKNQKDFFLSDSQYVEDLADLYTSLEAPKGIHRNKNQKTKELYKELYRRNQKILYQKFGFELKVAPSLIENAGMGAFVSKGSVKKRQLVALYPGIYL